MGVPRYSIRVMYVVWEGYSNQAMNQLVKQAKTGISPSLLQSSPCKLFTISVTLDCLSNLLAVQRAALCWTCSIWDIRTFVCGFQTAEAYILTGVLRKESKTEDKDQE